MTMKTEDDIRAFYDVLLPHISKSMDLMVAVGILAWVLDLSSPLADDIVQIAIDTGIKKESNKSRIN